MKKYIFNLLIAIDQFFAVLLSPVFNRFVNGPYKFGDPDETISSVMGKNIKENKCPICKGLCFILNFIDKRHCNKSIEEDEGKNV